MRRVVEDDISVWIFILSVSGKHWRVLSRRTGGTKAEESRMMPKCWRRYWWLLVQCNLAFVPISSSEISPNCSITLKIFSPHPPDVLSGICSPSPLFTHGNSYLIPWNLPSGSPAACFLSGVFNRSPSSVSTQVLFQTLFYVSTKRLPSMVSFISVDQHTPNSIARFQTYIYSYLMYLCAYMHVPHFPKSVHSKWSSLSFPSLVSIFTASYIPFPLQQTSQIRNWGVTLDDSSHTYSYS